MSDKKRFDMPAAIAMLYLCGCVLTETKPHKARLDDVNLKDLYMMSRFHTLTALVCEGLERANTVPADEIKKYFDAFKSVRQKAVRKNLLLDTERAKLCAFMEQNGIWYMPLKGVILKDMYPMIGLRQMADNDILFDEARRKEVKDWFLRQGYEVNAYGAGNHDVYRKEPVYNYEMHTSLYTKADRSEWHKYYKNIREKLLKEDGTSFAYRFTNEDFYIYFITHGFKHYDGDGNGLRFLCDMYVYVKAKQSEMDFDYITRELQTLGIDDFERGCRELIFELFENINALDFEKLTQEKRELLMCFLAGGAYGIRDNSTKKQLQKHGKLKCLFAKIFPGTAVLQYYHPIFRHKWLVPIGWICRAFKILFTCPGRVRHILRIIIKTDGESRGNKIDG